MSATVHHITEAAARRHLERAAAGEGEDAWLLDRVLYVPHPPCPDQALRGLHTLSVNCYAPAATEPFDPDAFEALQIDIVFQPTPASFAAAYQRALRCLRAAGLGAGDEPFLEGCR